MGGNGKWRNISGKQGKIGMNRWGIKGKIWGNHREKIEKN